MIKIIADENLEVVEALCSSWSDVELVPPDQISHSKIKNKDVLIVRSVTNVNFNLLDNTNIKFVGTPTSGINHIDTEFLDSKNITFSYAPGCNSNSVVDYVMSSITTLFSINELSNIKIGIIGYGNIGKKLGFCLDRFNIMYKFYDPFVSNNQFSNQSLSLYDFSDCDVISIHTSLTTSGNHPTYKMISKSFLDSLKENVIFINTSRGEVVDQNHLIDFISQNNSSKVILDVWDNEPNLNEKLFSLTTFATPHIAGHSFVGKQNGVLKVIDDLKSHYSIDSSNNDTEYRTINLSSINSLKDYVNKLQEIYKVNDDFDYFKNHINKTKSIKDSFLYFRKFYPKRNEINYE